MKNNIFKVFLFGIAFAFFAWLAPAASAATLDTAPAKLTVTTGEQVSVVIDVIPQKNERVYTAQVELRYPSDLFTFQTIAYNNEWIPVIRSEYDEATKGDTVIVKTAGYPGGFTDRKVFAVATFVAKRAGTGSITFGENSFVLDASNNNTLVGATIPSVVSLRSIEGGRSGPGYALASIVSFGEFSNTITFVSVFLFLLILYIIYLAMRPRSEDEE